MTKPVDQDLYRYVENMVLGPFDEEKLIELFNSDAYRETADKVFDAAVSEGNREIAAESIVWWQKAQANELQANEEQGTYTNDGQVEPQEEKDGGGIYLIIMVLFLIAYGIKALIG
ncbi:MAG: hypothetical protein MI976_16300 [Pseudomonadales bacterium]|nr:hypothetical protein [Pseudomonadales bacterium]